MRSPLLAGVLLSSLILVFAIGIVVLLRSAATAAPIEALPRNTSFLVRVQNPAELWRELSRTPLAISDQDAPAAVIDMLAPRMESLGLTLPSAARDFLAGSEREALLALVPEDPNTPAALVLVLEAGAGSLDFVQQAQRVFDSSDSAAAGQQAGAWTSRSHHGREYFSTRTAGGGLHVAGIKGLGILTTTGAAMRRVLDTLDGRAEPLAADAAYRATRDRLGRKADVLAWASGAWAMEQLERAFPAAEERRVLRLLGLAAANGVGLEADIRRGLFHERLVIAMKSEHRGLPAELMAGPPGRHRASHVVPATFPFYLSISCAHLDAVYRKLPDVLASTTGGDKRELRSRLHGAESFMALDPASGLLSALGDELVVGFGRTTPWPRGPAERRWLQTPAVATIGVTNRTMFAGFLERMDGLAKALASYEQIELEGRTVTSYRMTALEPLRPAYWLTPGRWVAATSPDLLTSALGAGTRKDSWADLPGMDELLGQLPDKSHALLVADTARLVDLLGLSDQAGLRASTRGLADLPVEHLPQTAVTVRMTSSGLLLDAVGPISPSLIVALSLEARDATPTPVEDATRSGVEETIPY